MGQLLLSLSIAAYIVVPLVFITGWIRWRRRPQGDPTLGISFIGFVLGSASALLAVVSILVAFLGGGFRYYDPVLLQIYRIGILLSLGGLVCAAIGAFGRSILRWYAPGLSLGMLVLWFLWASSE